MAPGPAEFALVLGVAINILSLATAAYKAIRLYRPDERPRAEAVVILPLTGSAPDLEILIGLLRAQTLCPKRLIIAVESEQDPSYRRALAVHPPLEFPIEVVVAGHAVDQAQKCRNQQAALERVDIERAIIVLMDGDIRPGPTWLASLVSPIADGEFDVVTGHRWQQVTSGGLGAHLIATIDRAVMLLPRVEFDFASVVWGGSLAISGDAASQIDLMSSLSGTLSDDLTIADHAARADVRMTTRSALLVGSPMELSLGAAWRFGRRQYQMCRIYRPWLWLIALATINLRLLGWLAALLLLLGGQALGWAIFALSGLGLAKQFLVGDIASRVGMADPPSVRIVQLALGLLQPVPDLFHSSLILAAGWARSVRWGHVTYDVAAPDRVRVKERRPFSS